MMRAVACLVVSLLLAVGCGGEPSGSAGPDPDPAAAEDNLDEASAQRLGVPLAILDTAFYFKPSSIDQSGLGVVLGEGAAFAVGATSQALPSMTTLDRKVFAELRGSRVAVDGVVKGSFGAFFDFAELAVEAGGSRANGARLIGRKVPPLFDVTAMKDGLSCRVLGADFDMYSSGPPRLISLAATTERVKTFAMAGKVVAYELMARTTKSTGGDGSLLVCDGKLAGISAGAGSQGTTFDFRSVDVELVDAFARARKSALAECRRIQKCR